MLNLELAMNDLPQKAELAANLAEAMQSARKAATVSGLMLTYLGQTHGKRNPLDLSEVCRPNLSLLHAVLPRNLALTADLATPGPVILANANEIQQALTNLITNAWEASGVGHAPIRLSIKTVAAKDIPAANRFPIGFQPQDRAYACMEVADAGGGIADSDIEKIFDPFFSRKSTGRGLGLPVVLGIVRAHQGAITVESEPGGGSVFRIFLPVSAEVVPQGAVPPAQAVAAVMGGTVLVVDDEPAVRQATKLALKRLGFQVWEAADGIEAVELYRQHQAEIRCVLCDLTMPRMDGWETLAALRKMAPGLPVVLASGYSEAHVMASDHPEQPQAFLNKPFEFKALADTMARVMAHMKA
jgi:two-component system, cell cycle sensor histidine kinase and response regulator CckA